MKRYFQYESDDCLRTAIGCIIELHPKHLPNFVRIWEDDNFNKMNEYIYEHYGISAVYVINPATKTQKDLHYSLAIKPPFGFSVGICRVISGYGKGSLHAVVCKHGEIVHDPANHKKKIWKKRYKLLGYIVIYDPSVYFPEIVE